MATPSTLTLLAEDGTQHTITRDAAKLSAVLNDMMGDLPEEETNVPVPIATSSSETLKMIIEWCEHRVVEKREESQKAPVKVDQIAKEAPKKDGGDGEDGYEAEAEPDSDEEHYTYTEHGVKTRVRREPKDLAPRFEVPAWEAAFLGPLSQAQLFALIVTVNFLDIPRLMKCVAKVIAEKIKGMKTEEMREYFGIENDLTKEEEDELRKEHAWIHNKGS
ncbi:Skp1 family, dimerization domain-containing protein [Annulohypoxylon moriforme]|nr:Skp1 family, dimerization domain-containing protein [Annulohypoxylon moriforme]